MAAIKFYIPLILYLYAFSWRYLQPFILENNWKSTPNVWKTVFNFNISVVPEMEAIIHSQRQLSRTAILESSPKGTFIYVILSLLMLNGNVELNPEPIKFLCGFCHKQERRNQRAVCCDSCDLWYHTKCIRMPLEVYNGLNNLFTSWICSRCGSSNFSSSLNSSNADFSA